MDSIPHFRNPRPLLPWLGICVAALLTVLGASVLGGLERDKPTKDTASRSANNAKNCSKCHGGSGTNSGSGSAAVVGVPREFTPGATYGLTIRTAETGRTVWGHQLTATDSNGVAVGSFSNPDAFTEIVTDGILQFVLQNSQGNFAGTPDGPVVWHVDWTAPPPGGGPAYFWMSTVAGDNDLTQFNDSTYNFARASVEAGTVHLGATIMAQPDFPTSGIRVLSRGAGDDLRVAMRVSNHKPITENYTVVTRVKLPSGSIYPGAGYLSSDPLTLTSGQTGTVHFSQTIPPIAPLGLYEFQAIVGIAPSTFVDLFVFPFEVVP